MYLSPSHTLTISFFSFIFYYYRDDLFLAPIYNTHILFSPIRVFFFFFSLLFLFRVFCLVFCIVHLFVFVKLFFVLHCWLNEKDGLAVLRLDNFLFVLVYTSAWLYQCVVGCFFSFPIFAMLSYRFLFFLLLLSVPNTYLTSFLIFISMFQLLF
jgi:hypothetical protein